MVGLRFVALRKQLAHFFKIAGGDIPGLQEVAHQGGGVAVEQAGGQAATMERRISCSLMTGA